MGDILKDKVAVVTGSGQGIGRAIAISLAREGARVVTNNRKPGSTNFAILAESALSSLEQEKREWVLQLSKEYSGDAESTAQEIRSFGGEAVAFFGDVSEFEVAGQLVQTAVEAFGKIDILVNVAGTFGFSPVWEMTEELWDHVNRVKPKSYFNCIRHAAPFMMRQRWGRIINCTSKAWAGDNLRHCQYAAANAGVVGLTRAVANELYPHGITCNAFAPWARTRASFELAAYKWAAREGDSPYVGDREMPFEVTPTADHVGPFIAYLASDEAAAVSGAVFSVGGSTIGIYSDPEVKTSITKYSGPWTVDELRKQVPKFLLAGYRNRAESP